MTFQPCVHIMASKRNGTLYTGVTSEIAMRAWMHKEGRGSKFCAKYGVNMLVWLECHETMDTAITREKRIKEWKRAWKLELIEGRNPDWRDLYDDLNS